VHLDAADLRPRVRHRAFTDALAGGVQSLVVGDPLDDATDVSSLIAPTERDRVKSWIDEACADGATAIAGGDVDGTLLHPTVLDGVIDAMTVSRREVFGPVVGIHRYTELSDALARANASNDGLQAGIFTRALDTALHAARTLDFGGVVVNDVPTWRADNQPYGGVRDSGNTREGPAYSVREMTESRLVVLHGGC
jgi:acyl-CoA reductase-like NAD-dependent aldehyde dehydrogenase